MLSIYCVHPISGMSSKKVFNYYQRLQKILTEIGGFDIFIPMFGKASLRTELKLRSHDYRGPLTNNHSIFNRDKWMVQKSDILLCNLSKTKRISIGSIMEIAWGNLLGKQIIIIMEKNNIHRHSFTLESATTIFETEKEAIDYLTKLVRKEY